MDGAYGTLMGRLLAGRAPNLLLLTYDRRALAVRDLVAVPGHFFTPAIVEKRKPLAPTARRRGWVGCNILVGDLPQAGRLSVIHEGVVQDKGQVRATWQATVFLEGNSPTEGRSWLIEVMRSIERLARPDFTLADLYADEARLGQVFPGNAHVRPKIRQQLQILRDRGYLSFQGSGRYRLSDATA